VTGAITIHQTALHAALAELRDRGGEREDTAEAAAFLIDGLNVLTRLLDPYAAIGAAQRAAALPEGRARKLADDTDTAPSATAKAIEDLARFIDDHGACIGCGRVYHADRLRMCDGGEMHCPDCWPRDQKIGETPAPPTITTTAGPGPSAQADGGGAPAMEGAASPPLTPAPAQAAGGDVPRKRGRQGERAPDVWTAERQALLRDRYPHEGASGPLIADLLALPGPPFPGKKAVHAVAKRFGITVLPEAAARINRELAAHARAIFLARKAERGDAPPPKKWTPQRLTMLEAEWPTCTDRAALLDRINALPGDPVENVEAMRQKAKERRIFATPETKFVLRSQGGRKGGAASPSIARPMAHIAPAPIAAPATPATEKEEAFDLFSAGSTVRDVHADLGTPISTLANWHAEWQRTRVRPQQQEARV
jgi:hypothetical protein